MLTAIDYSENIISSFEVVPDEHEFKSLKKLNLSHNSLDNILDGTFELFPNIESLDLSHNLFGTLDIMFFEGIKKLLHLNLANNRIASIDSSFNKLRYLVTLDLSYNIIEKLNARDFAKLVNLEEIKLDSNGLHTIEKNFFKNMPSLTTISIQDNAIDSIDQEIFINATKLRNVYLSRNRIKILSKDLFKNKTIFDFTIEGNQLEGPLERGCFEGLAMVKELDLSGQHLTSIENYAFAGLKTLETLLLNNNAVELLRNYSFKGLQSLNILDLSYNKINDLDIVTEDLISLQVLTLHHNKIAHISSNNYISLGSLQLLDLSHNNISYLGSNYFRSLQSLLNFKISDNPLFGSIVEYTFDGLSSLPSLDISGTLITTVNNGSFIGMTILRDLNISHSNITELQYNSLSYVCNIRTIDLSNNRLSVFDVNTTDLRNLDTLLLNNNMLQIISQTVFKGLSLLRTVVLSYNSICTIHEETFQKDIRNLDLSYNPELEFDVLLVKQSVNLANLYISGTKTVSMSLTFENVKGLLTLEMTHLNIHNISILKLFNLQRLEMLVLNNNAVSTLNIGALSNLTSLKQLDLSYNSLNYIQPGVFKENTYLKILNISHNKLLEISHGIFQGLLYVEVIDLSFNKIKDLHRSRFYDVEHLDTLIVDNNEIEFISDDEFLGSSLTKLSIGGNPLPCKILYKIKRKSFHISITAINIEETKDNLKGVTCNKEGYNFDSNVAPETVEHNKLLFDIRNILYNVSRGQIFIEPVGAKYIYNDSSHLESIINQEQKMNQHSLEIINSIKNLSSVSNLTSIINSNTNILLGKILQVLTAKESITTSKPIIVIKENTTSGSLLSYINKIKQDLEDTLAVERQNVLQLDNKINRLNSKIDLTMTTKTPIHEKSLKTKDEEKQKSVFTEVCVGLILVILICFILYKIYKSELYLPRGWSRTSTSSRRNIAESMESAQL
ncbi:protein artichoke-like [Cydia amplana]|uniref:protein artichoke-like n=1 Tax=Cydia amplana TaxID=1869771 RepID=UPI002FE62405